MKVFALNLGQVALDRPGSLDWRRYPRLPRDTLAVLVTFYLALQCVPAFALPQPTAVASLPAPRSAVPLGPCGRYSDAEPLTMILTLGKSKNMVLGGPMRLRAIGNAAVVRSVQTSPSLLYLLGVGIGSTDLVLQERNGVCRVVNLVVQVDPSALRQALAKLMPKETGVTVSAAAGALVLSGTVSDAPTAQRVIDLAKQFLPSANKPVPTKDGAAATQDSGVKIINLLQVAAPQQVMLEVKVVEVSKTLMSKLGIVSSFSGGIGNVSLQLATNLLSGPLAAGHLLVNGGKGVVDAEKRDDLMKILAEPNLVAVSGQKAYFLAGGKIYLPVPQGDGKITLQAEPYGVGLTFTPTVLANGLINLQVAPEVSELSQTGQSIGVGAVQWNLPVITTRRAETTVQVYDGQSFAIGGLLKNNITGSVKGLPGLSDLPLLGALFRSTAYQNDQTELVFVVTPRLAKALPKDYALPTDSFGKVDPNRVLFDGNMEGQKPAASSTDHPAPAALTQRSESR